MTSASIDEGSAASASRCTLRVATVDDIAAIVPMMIAFNRFEGIDWNAQAGAAPLRQLLQDDRLGFIGLFETAAVPIAGYAVITYGFDLEFGGRDAFLTELFLKKELRGQGLGKQALALVCDKARKEGCFAVHLQVRHDNVAAHRLYLSAGFVGTTRIFLSKPLSAEVKLSNVVLDTRS